jgi:hypothetical protein
MPYESVKQAAYIHMLADKGVPWAVKFVKDSKGTHVQKRKKLKNAKTKS